MVSVSINDRQAAALVYVKNNEVITNREYQELNSVDSVTAAKELRYLLEQELLVQHGTRGGSLLYIEKRKSDEPLALRK